MIKTITVPYFISCLVGLLGCVFAAKAVDLGGTHFSDSLIQVGEGQPAVTVCDFNSDGNQDVIVANYSDNNMITYQGDGKGGLTEVGRYLVGQNPTGMAVSDINSDGNVDVIIANHETSYVTLLFGDGKGSFNKAPNSPFNIGVHPHPHEVQLSDLDGDAFVDLVVDSRDDEGVLVLKGLGNGTFATPGKVISVGGDPYRGFAIKDLNGDGHLDLVTPNQRDVGVVISTDSDKMSFSLNKLQQSEAPFAVELADLNGDGNLDLVVATNGSSISVIPGDGNGHFQIDQKITIDASNGAKQIAVGDINGDGLEDALITNWSGEILAILGSKTAINTTSFKHPRIPNPWGVALTDLNNDGKSDFIIADGDSNVAVVYVSQ
ncbi:MAG TPA: VCBS repeat-containing protein [Kangiella sp.]